MQKYSLVKTWIELETRGGLTKAAALRDLNEELGTDYKSNRLYEWLAGTRPTPTPVRDYMLRVVIESVIHAEVKNLPLLSDAALDRMAAKLC